MSEYKDRLDAATRAIEEAAHTRDFRVMASAALLAAWGVPPRPEVPENLEDIDWSKVPQMPILLEPGPNAEESTQALSEALEIVVEAYGNIDLPRDSRFLARNLVTLFGVKAEAK